MGWTSGCIGILLTFFSVGATPGCTCGGDADRKPQPVGAASGIAGGDRTAESGYRSGVGTDDFELSADAKKALLALARASVEAHVRSGKVVEPSEDMLESFPRLSEQRSCFVTLRKQGELRGCIGSLEPRRSLIDDVRFNAVSAAIHDTRFQPVAESELGELTYSISVLTLPRPLEGVSGDALPAYMARHKPGVIIEYQGRRSTFLPSVWEDLPDATQFLSRLCRKQGSPPSCWRDTSAKISTYESIHFTDKDAS
jgi:AmmeMemoRadiSam system protein A